MTRTPPAEQRQTHKDSCRTVREMMARKTKGREKPSVSGLDGAREDAGGRWRTLEGAGGARRTGLVDRKGAQSKAFQIEQSDEADSRTARPVASPWPLSVAFASGFASLLLIISRVSVFHSWCLARDLDAWSVLAGRLWGILCP